MCTKCEGKGYTLETATFGGELKVKKIWCEFCEGTGRVKLPPDNREGIEWEGE